MKDYVIIPCVITVILAFVVGIFCGYEFGISLMQEKAIRAGHAEWGADARGKAQFKWREAKP